MAKEQVCERQEWQDTFRAGASNFTAKHPGFSGHIRDGLSGPQFSNWY
jgi:hypothetical protein